VGSEFSIENINVTRSPSKCQIDDCKC